MPYFSPGYNLSPHFLYPGRDATTIDQLKHDLVLSLTHHSFEELPDALEYYLASPNSDLEGNLANQPV